MNHFRLAVEDKTYEVEILNDPRAEEVQVKVDGNIYTVKAEDLDTAQTTGVQTAVTSTPAPARAASAPVASAPVVDAAAAGSNTVRAPLPGKITSVKVSTGQNVKVNDPLVVIEAMKAQNIIRAQRDGKIGKIYVSVGGHIAHGAPLLDIE